ncbi:MAG: FAD-binding oxidoreductase [Bdellovibrionaceae bacterium]|nr:FAD-binding oxidoreductase [Pseudobdellovibrionaceae bacterium]
MIKSLTLALVFLASFTEAKVVVNDITQLNPIEVASVFQPTSIEQIQDYIKNNKGKISIGGGRYSMGGQTALAGALHIDMRKLNKVVVLDVKKKRVTVEAGIRWRQLQEAIDPHDLSIKIMQTYSNFTVGGSLSVNVHGRYVGQGPIIRSVESIKLVMADGHIEEASPTQNAELFNGAIGGYGGLGVIVEATLQLVDNGKVERTTKSLSLKKYSDYFFKSVRDNADAVFHNGDLYPPDFKDVMAVTWLKSKKPLTEEARLIPANDSYSLQPFAIKMISSSKTGKKLRQSIIDPLNYKNTVVVWRNHEASYDVAELEPKSRSESTYVLQEYFVPVEKLVEFIEMVRPILKKPAFNVVNVSIRHALPDTGSFLAWAPTEVFSLVIYYRQKTDKKTRESIAKITRELISAAVKVGGRYYLPYQIHATSEQFHQAYPRAKEFFALKQKWDPLNRLTNSLWDRYYKPEPVIPTAE